VISSIIHLERLPDFPSVPEPQFEYCPQIQAHEITDWRQMMAPA
jgi:hypothetical protein